MRCFAGCSTAAVFAELHRRIENTTTYLKAVTQAQLAGAEDRRVELKLRDYNPVFTGASYLFSFGLPNFYFHLTTAYDILRHKGAPLSKRDFLRLMS